MKEMKDYKYHYTIKGKLYFSFEQKEKAVSFFGAARFVYNRMIAIDNEIYQLKKVAAYVPIYKDRINYLFSVKQSAKWFKNSAPFLWDIPDEVVANAIKNYKTAWKNMREQHKGIPVYKRKRENNSFQINPHYHHLSREMNDCKGFHFLDIHHVYLPKLGQVRIQCSDSMLLRIFEKRNDIRIGTVTIKQDSTGEFFLFILFGSDLPFNEFYPSTGKAIAIDLNLENFITMNDNTVIDSPRYLQKAEDKLKKEQRCLSRRAKRAIKEKRPLDESKNYQKQRMKVAEMYRKVSRQRKEFHCVLANDLIKNHDIIIAENINANKLLQNRILAKSIEDAGWRSFLFIIQAKALLTGRRIILVDPAYTSQTCSRCGYRLTDKERLSLKDRNWICPNCGVAHSRDQNAAENILKSGLQVS